MNKIICDVCGTSYPETASQCPICGYVKPSKAKAAPKEDGGYVYVKGGRFSAANVQKRNMDKGITPTEQPETQKSKKGGGNMVLGITAIVLLLILIVVMAFFIVKIVDEFKNNTQPTIPPTQITTTQSTPTTQDPDVQVPCQSVTVGQTEINLAEVGDTYLLSVVAEPHNTTDLIMYSSSDESIATVDAKGLITAVAEGQVTVTVTCGKAEAEITVTCGTTEETTDPTESTEADEEESLVNRKDITLSQKGETWDLYSKTAKVPKNKIKWTSEDETVVTVEGGVVTAVGNGITTVTAEYEKQTYSCTVRCSIPDDESQEEKPQTSVDTSSLRTSQKDVTLKVDGKAHEKSFYLYLQDKDGIRQTVTWTADKEGYVTIEGNKITAVKTIKQVIISTTFEGETYQCIVRIN